MARRRARSLICTRRIPTNACTQGFQVPSVAWPKANQSGVVFFPGSEPLYINGVLVGGLGVSGDGVDQDDYVTAGGAVGFEAPANIRADQIVIDGVRLPYLKFPRNPTRYRSLSRRRVANQTRALHPSRSLCPGKISQAVVGGVLVHFGKRRIIEDEVDEGVESHAGFQRHHSEMNQLGGALTDDLHAQQACGLTWRK